MQTEDFNVVKQYITAALNMIFIDWYIKSKDFTLFSDCSSISSTVQHTSLQKNPPTHIAANPQQKHCHPRQRAEKSLNIKYVAGRGRQSEGAQLNIEG